MKFLVDQPVSPMLASWLRSAEGGGHDAVHVRERGLSGATDVDLFSIASTECRIIVTSDLDFARLLALSGNAGPGLILFRAGNITDVAMLALLQRVLAETTADALPGSAVVVDEQSIRIATLPIMPRA